MTTTDITIILDRSGSMASVAHDTIGGFNTFLRDQQQVPGKATLTLNQFDDICERVLDAVDIGKAKALDQTTFVPGGSTALLDAIGTSIQDTGKRLETMAEYDRPQKVICVIITDGEENSSKKFTQQQINDMISEQRDKYQWQFVFLGANQDAISSASSIGINAANAMTYANNTQGVASSYGSLSRNLTACRMSVSADMAFSDEDRKAQKKAGV
jgi:hypothetical protein